MGMEVGREVKGQGLEWALMWWTSKERGVNLQELEEGGQHRADYMFIQIHCVIRQTLSADAKRLPMQFIIIMVHVCVCVCVLTSECKFP